MVSGRGLAAVIRRRYSRWVLWGACVLLIVANVINIGADLGGMARSHPDGHGRKQHLAGLPAFERRYRSRCSPGFIYAQIARIFKWLTLVLFAYVITAFLAQPDWGAGAARYVCSACRMVDGVSVRAGGHSGNHHFALSVFLAGRTGGGGRTRPRARPSVAQREGATDEELRRSRIDVVTGMFFSNFVMYFIILTTAATLHAHGVTHIDTAKQAAEALRPLAGNGAYWLFTLGLIGTGMLGVPVLAGSSAYAISEAMAWRASLNTPPDVAPKFYGVLATAMLLGAAWSTRTSTR